MFPMTIRARCTALALAALAIASTPANARTWFVAEMNTRQIRALDHASTVVLLPGGILEEHGPYLPSYTDGYVSERMARDVADALVGKGHDVLIFPPLALGSGGANELGGIYPYPGTYVVRLETLRAVYMDLADELGEAGFKSVFVINSHGAPNHNRYIDQACDYFTGTWGGRMLHISGYGAFGAPGGPRSTLSEQALKEDAYSGHAGIDETSLLLFLRPDLVDPAYKNAPSFPATTANGGMIAVAKGKDWKGYFGAPRYASAEYGAKLYHLRIQRMIKQALDALAAPPGKPPRRPAMLRGVDNAAIARDNAIEQRQQEWLRKNGHE